MQRLLVLAVIFVAACDVPAVDDNNDEPRRVPQLPSCADDTDCETGELCVDDRCHATCSTDGDCGGDRDLCATDLGVCVRCLADGDCAEGQVCDGPSGECLDDTAGDGSCTPDALGCVDEHTAFVCSHDGTEKTEAACRDDQRCIEGVCHSLVCTPDVAVCAGNSRVLCDATGTETTVIPCSDGCTEELGCSCVEGACVERTCTPNAARCVGNSAQECDALGLEFSPLTDCGADSCVGGRCLPDTCTAGATFCSGDHLLTCNSGGTGFDESACAQACTGADGHAACTDRVCEPLSATCVDGGTVRVCNSDGTASADVPCQDGETCTDGVCQQSECVPDCGARTCGLDPVCGASCGDCAGTCSSSGVCAAPSGPTLEVVLSWTPSTEDLDLYLSRDPTETTMCTSDTCFFQTCQSNDPRPDWDGTGSVSNGDPLLEVTDVSHDNPEVASITVPDGQSASFRVGADNFGGVDQGTATTATATVRIKLDGVVVATHSRSVATNAQWRGVVIGWNGTSVTSADDGTVQSAFDCQSPTGGPACSVDGDCPDGQACITDFLGISGNCQTVQCTTDAQCGGGGQLCSGSHTCVAGPLKGWKAACANSTECHEGFHCDALTNQCEEACNPSFCTAPNTDGCCPKTGGDTCTPDAFFGITGNCAP